MKSIIRKSIKLFILFLFLSICSCEKDSYDDAKPNSSKTQTTGKINKVRIEDVPFLLPSIEKFNSRKATLRGVEDLDLDLQKIVEYLGANGYITYSIPINRKDFENDDYYFENLNITKIGNQYEPVIVKYNAEDDSKKFDLSTFTGKMEIIDIEKTSGGIFIYENGSKMADPAPPTNPSGEEWGGSGDADPPGWMPTWMAEFLGYWNGLGNNNSGPGTFSTIIHYIGSSCNCNDYTPYVLVVTPVNMGTVVNHTETGNNSGGDVVLVPTIPNWPLNLVNPHVMGNLIRQRLTALNPEAGVWLSMNATLPQNQSIYHYLLDFDYYDHDANNFAASLVNQMHLNPSYNFNPLASALSPGNIDLSQVTPNPNDPNELNHDAKVRFMCIYNKLMQSQEFKKLFQDTFQDSTRPNVKFEIDNTLPNTRLGETHCDPANRFNNVIKINLSLLSNTYNNMEAVKTIIHECIHAFLNVKLADPSIGMSIPSLNNLELPETFNYYCNFTNSQDQHDFMFNYMLPTFQTILSEVKDSLVSASSNNIVNGISIYQQTGGPSTPWNWNQYYKYLILKGLESTNFFRSEIADLANNQIINANEFLLYNQYNSNGSEDISKSCVN